MIRRSQKEDSNAVIHRVRMKPLIKSQFCIPLCRLQCLPLVRPISEVDVARLQNEFVMGYRDDDRAMYVAPYKNLDEVLHVSDDVRASWSLLWQEANDEFDSMFQNDPDLAHFVGKMFFVWEGNHRLTTWWRHINKHHSLDKDWHISVDCIVVDRRNCTAVFLNVMNDINWLVQVSFNRNLSLFHVSLFIRFSLLCISGLLSTIMLKTTSLQNCFAFVLSGK